MNRPSASILAVIAAAILTTVTALPAAAAGKITIPPTATIDPNAGVNAKVRDECVPDARVTELLKEQLKAAGYDVTVAKQAGGGKSLQLTILNVTGVGGGAWSGPKSMTVSGKLYQDGKVVGSFNGRRTSGGGFFGAYKGTCSIIGRCAKALAKDITVWLENPTMDARLGEM
jgi:hypothetical protein